MIKINLKSIGVKIILNVFIIAIAVYFMVQFAKTGGDIFETERAEIKTRQDNVEIYGYVFINEEVIYSTGGNSVNYLLENGKKVGKNQLIAYSHQTPADFSMKDQITALTEKLDILNQSNVNLEIVSPNIERINGDISSIYADMVRNIEKGKINETAKNRNELLILLNKRQLITGEVSGRSFENTIASAEEKKRQLESQVTGSGIGSREIYSNKAGIFYSRTDGYENSFTAEAAKTLDFNMFGELIEKEPDINIINNALGKVAYDFNWYLVCKTEKNKTIDFTVDKLYNIIYPFSSNKTTESVLIKKIESTDSDEIILVFETAAIPVDFDFSRKQTVRIVFNEISGIKVLEEAVNKTEREDGTSVEGVYILRGNQVIFRELPQNECLGKFDGYYLYLEPSKRKENGSGKLQLYEDVIISGKNLYNGRAVD